MRNKCLTFIFLLAAILIENIPNILQASGIQIPNWLITLPIFIGSGLIAFFVMQYAEKINQLEEFKKNIEKSVDGKSIISDKETGKISVGTVDGGTF